MHRADWDDQMVKTIYLKESNCFKESVLLYLRSLLPKPFCLFWWNFDKKNIQIWSPLLSMGSHPLPSESCTCFKSQIQALSSPRKIFLTKTLGSTLLPSFPHQNINWFWQCLGVNQVRARDLWPPEIFAKEIFSTGAWKLFSTKELLS